MELSGMALVGLLIVGAVIGVIGGMLGIGGGVLVIPALVFLFGFTHAQAIGTSLGMLLPPIGIFAFHTYYRDGQVNLTAAAVLAVGFAVGALIGSKLVVSGHIPANSLRLFFGLLLFYVAAHVILQSEKRTWAATVALGAFAIAAVSYVVMRAIGRRMEWQFSLRDRFNARLEEPIAPDYEI